LLTTDSTPWCPDSNAAESKKDITIWATLFPRSVFTAQEWVQELVSKIGMLSKWQWGVVSTMTFAGDETGLSLASAMLDAVESWAQIDIFKCKRWGAFDGWESSGDWFIPLDFSQRLRAKGLRSFYNNEEVSLSWEISWEIQRVRSLLLHHPNFSLHNDNYYEHGKLGMWYEVESWEVLWSTIWGASIRNEWWWKWENQYIDSMVYLQHAWMSDMLAETLCGKNPGTIDGLQILTWDNYKKALDSVLSQKWEIRSSISYLWESQRISSLESTEVELFFSRIANVNRWRNLHFLHELFRRINKWFHWGLRGRKSVWDLISYWRDFCSMSIEDIPDSFKVILLDQTLHMKTISRWNMLITGSWNFVEKWYGELWLAMKSGISNEVDQMMLEIHDQLDTISCLHNTSSNAKIWMHPINSELSNWELLQFSLVRSQIEHAIMSLESFLASHDFMGNIALKRRQRQEFFMQTLKR